MADPTHTTISNLTLAVVESIATIPTYNSSIEILTDLNIQQIHSWRNFIHNLTLDFADDLYKIDLDFSSNNDFHTLWIIYKDSVKSQLDTKTLNRIDDYFTTPSTYGISRHIIQYPNIALRQKLNVTVFPTKTDISRTNLQDNSIFIRSMFARKFENSSIVYNKIIGIRALFTNARSLITKHPNTVQAVNDTINAYSHIAQEITILAQYILMTLNTPLIEPFNLIPHLQDFPISHALFNQLNTRNFDELTEKLLAMGVYSYSKYLSTVIIHITLPIIDTNNNLTLKQLNALPIRSMDREFTIDHDPFLYLQNDHNKELFYAPNNLLNDCFNEPSKSKCLINYDKMRLIHHNSCLRQILNISIPFTNCMTTTTINQVTQIIPNDHWSVIHQHPFISFPNNFQQSSSYSRHTIELNSRQLNLLTKSYINKSNNHSALPVILYGTMSGAIMIGLILAYFMFKHIYHSQVDNDHYPSNTFIRANRIDSMYDHIDFTFNPLQRQTIRPSNSPELHYQTPRTPATPVHNHSSVVTF